MFFRLFDWLVKKTPYTLAFALVCFSWFLLVGGFGFLLVCIGADFEATGTGNKFILLYLISTGIGCFLILTEFGLFRLFGIKWERREFKVLNENILKGHFRQDVSDEDLLRAHDSLHQIGKLKEKRNILYSQIIVFTVTLGEWFFSGQLTNVPIVFLGITIAACSLYVFGAVFYDSITSPARRECKMLLARRGIHFEETHFLSLKTKSKFFIILIGFALLALLILIKPLNPIHIVLAIITLIVIGLLNDLVFRSIYTEFTEIKESAKNLAEGKRALFFSGSTDKEMLDLSKNLNETAQVITTYQKALEEEKVSLEIKVKARTKELEELAQGLDQKVKEKTQELQDRVNELEKFHRLTVGRELKMVELKKEIKKLKEKKIKF